MYQYTAKCKILQNLFKKLPNLMKYIIIYYIWIHCPISMLYEEFHSSDFTNNILMRFFIQTSVSVWIHKFFLKKHYHWKITRIVKEDLCQKSIFNVSQYVRWNEKKIPKIIQNVLKNEYIFLPEMYHHSVLSPTSHDGLID